MSLNHEQHNPIDRAIWHPVYGWLLIETCSCPEDKGDLVRWCLELEDDPDDAWTARDTVWLFTRLYGDAIPKLLKDLEAVRP